MESTSTTIFCDKFDINPPILQRIIKLQINNKSYSQGWGNLTIGRSRWNDVIIKDKSVSAFHANLEVNTKGVFITDLQSANGTFVDNAKIHARIRNAVKHGSKINISNVTGIIEIDELGGERLNMSETMRLNSFEESFSNLSIEIIDNVSDYCNVSYHNSQKDNDDGDDDDDNNNTEKNLSQPLSITPQATDKYQGDDTFDDDDGIGESNDNDDDADNTEKNLTKSSSMNPQATDKYQDDDIDDDEDNNNTKKNFNKPLSTNPPATVNYQRDHIDNDEGDGVSNDDDDDDDDDDDENNIEENLNKSSSTSPQATDTDDNDNSNNNEDGDDKDAKKKHKNSNKTENKHRYYLRKNVRQLKKQVSFQELKKVHSTKKK